ncbi:MAG: PDZ domain-containing protein, partial [Oscillospiraceae bacterium]|nr:PDZ domain-containing protein [Oscillospiraceae bacterium]
MNKKISLGSAFILICFSVLLTFMITYVNTYNKFNANLANTGLGDRVAVKLAELERITGAYYIGEIDRQKILDGLAMGYVMGLGDRYAYYFNADEYAEYQLSNQGKLVGIGVEVMYAQEMGGVIEITLVYPDSPAMAGGMLEGDYIYKVEGELVSELGYFEAIERIRGEIGTQVALTIMRNGPDFEELAFELTRDEVQTQSVKYRMINGDIGYIRIKTFNRETPGEFINAVNELTAAGAS